MAAASLPPVIAARSRVPVSAVFAAPVFLLFLVLKVYANHPAASDENIYFYMSVRTAFDGLWPYRDYFFAHTPLHILISVAVFKLVALAGGLLHGSLVAGVAAMTSGTSWEEGGLALTVAKAIPAASALLAGVGIYASARRAGAVEAVLAAASFLLADQVLRASSHFTGIAEAALCTALGMLALLAGRDRLCGLAFAAGCLVAMYVAPVGAAVWLVLLAISPRRARTVALWTAVPLVAVHGFFLLAVGRPYWDGVVLYHLKKPGDVRTFAETFWPILSHNSHLFFALPTALVAALLDATGLLGLRTPETVALPAPDRLAERSGAGSRSARRRAGRVAEKRARRATTCPQPAATPAHSAATRPAIRAALADLLSLARLREDPRRQLLAVASAAMAASLVFLSSQNPVFDFYFVMVFVSAAMLAGYAYGVLVRAGWCALRALARREAAARYVAAFLVLVACVAGGEVWERSAGARRIEVDDALAGVRVRHAWRPAPRLGFIDALVRAALWRDEEVLGTRYLAPTEYLWHESVVFDAPRGVAAYVRASTPPGATLFGDSYLAPLVALMSERRLALDEADTNPMRFASGITPARQLVERMERQPPLVILADASIAGQPDFAAWIGRHYEWVRDVEDPAYEDVTIYRRKGT
jgi:hypothetical protein